MTDEPTGQPEEAASPPPVLRVVNPDATPEEIAALVAVFSALGGPSDAPRKPRSAWASPARGVRRPLPQGRGGWRTSSLPG